MVIMYFSYSWNAKVLNNGLFEQIDRHIYTLCNVWQSRILDILTCQVSISQSQPTPWIYSIDLLETSLLTCLFFFSSLNMIFFLLQVYMPTSFDKSFGQQEVNKHLVHFSFWDTSGKVLTLHKVTSMFEFPFCTLLKLDQLWLPTNIYTSCQLSWEMCWVSSNSKSRHESSCFVIFAFVLA